jgi:hypothetical protein
MKIEKISKFFNKASIVFDKASVVYYRLVCVVVVLCVLFPYIWKIISSGEIDKTMVMLETLIMISATLSILVFTYTLAVRDILERPSKNFVVIGERFLKSTILFILGILLLYFSTNVLKIETNTLAIAKSITDIIALVLVFLAIYQFSSGVFDAIWFLFFKKEK